MGRRVISLWRAALLLVFCTSMAAGQTGSVPKTPILTIESDRLFVQSVFGQRVDREIKAEQSVLLAENRKIEAELTAEEKRLTEMRKTIAPADFRAIADAFDQRVQDIRNAQDAKARSIAERADRERANFIQSARPILIEIMGQAGAGMILERRSILVSDDAIDITDRAITQLNLTIGDGATLSNDQ